jgi:DNA-directed RNA polymerase subunit RPC12/RpoP
MNCSKCSGRGEVTCMNCGRTGKVIGYDVCTQGDGEIECSDCNGRGHVDCSACSGQGEMAPRDEY